MLKIRNFIKKEAVFFISAICAIITMLFVKPSPEYFGYIDLRVLCLLFSLMAVVAAFKYIGVFKVLTYGLLSRIRNGRLLGITLVLLPFFSSMLVTNDVALIVFIPFTIDLLSRLSCEKSIVPLIVLQTVAANLGSMATPVGNPQNLFLYSFYSLGIGEFFSVTLPLTAVSLIFLTIAAYPVLPQEISSSDLNKEVISDKKQLLVFWVVFILCLLSVFRIVPYLITTFITVAVIILLNRKLFKEIDFMLLLTFVCFFIISGNLGMLEAVKSFLHQLLERNCLITGVGASQIISNVPAAVLLSGFTDNWRDLLAGVNIGGLGTPIASLASLITLKLYLKSPDAKTLKFLAVFTVANIIGIIILLSVTLII